MLSLARLESIAIEVIGGPLRLDAGQSAADVPGWDSLNNTLIALDISHSFGIEVSGWDLGQCSDFGALVAMVNAKLSG